VDLLYYIDRSRDAGKKVSITVFNEKDEEVYSFSDEALHGFNQLEWNLRIGESQDKDRNGKYLEKGTYTLEFKRGRFSDTVTLEIK
jgi:hypothetical protein